ncbi:MAG: hypothetical protein AAGD05_07180, partial [Bacteroidota bacterium]
AKTAGEKQDLHIIQMSETESTPYIYYKGRLLMEYLMAIRGMSYDEILNDEITEAQTFTSMLAWHAATPPSTIIENQ